MVRAAGAATLARAIFVPLWSTTTSVPSRPPLLQRAEPHAGGF
jgi:hypothetical protein